MLKKVFIYVCVCFGCPVSIFLSFHTVDVCVVDHVLEVYSFDSIALHMDGLNQIPQTQSRVMFNGAEVTLQQLLGENMARFSDHVYT